MGVGIGLMTTTYIDAYRTISGMFSAAWTAQSAAIVGYVPQIRWQNVGLGAAPASDKYWVRFSVQTVLSVQDNVGSQFADAPGQVVKKFCTYGLVKSELFCPSSDTAAMLKGMQLVTIAHGAFCGKYGDGGVWFRNTRINELPPEDGWVRFNAVAEFEYNTQVNSGPIIGA